MIILDTTTKSLEILLGGAITTNQLPFVSDYVEVTSSASSFTSISQDGQSNNTTAVTVVGAPGASSTQRQVKFVSVYNADTVNAIVTVRLNNNGTYRNIVVITLNAGDTLFYTDGEGWKVLNTSGQIKFVRPVLGPAVTTLTYAATVTLDFSGADYQLLTLTGAVTFVTSNLAPGRAIAVKVDPGSINRNLTFPAWVFLNQISVPSNQNANKIFLLSLLSLGTTDANVLAGYSSQL